MAKKIKTTKKNTVKKATGKKVCKKSCSNKTNKVCEKNNSNCQTPETNPVETKYTKNSLCQRVLGWFFSQAQDDTTTEFYRRKS